MLAALLGSWVVARVATWDAPLDLSAIQVAQPEAILFADSRPGRANGPDPAPGPAPQSIAYQYLQDFPQYAPPAPYPYADPARLDYPPPARYPQVQPFPYPVAYPSRPYRAEYRDPALREAASPDEGVGDPAYDESASMRSAIASGHQLLMREAFGVDWHSAGVRSGAATSRKRGDKRRSAAQQVAPPPFTAQPLPTTRPAADRWSLDVFGFYRQGSSALAISQARSPIYGASQLGANLQWRAAPSSSHDPRLYARAYHALVSGGESELAAGVSALPVGWVPVRVYGELRLTRNPPDSAAGLSARTDWRPAAYAATEIPPQKLPLGLSLETYAAGGYVGGDADTYFLDGQSAVTGQLAIFRNPGSSAATLSLGGGVWGGAQRDASRVDVGPTLRLDMNLGEVPARISVDYREQVAGDAEPDSGVAATVSTRF
jgi:hypothetical protein